MLKVFSVTLSTTKANSYGDGDLVDVLVSSLQVTLFTVVAGVDIERPAPKAAWRAGACPRPACSCQEKIFINNTETECHQVVLHLKDTSHVDFLHLMISKLKFIVMRQKIRETIAQHSSSTWSASTPALSTEALMALLPS